MDVWDIYMINNWILHDYHTHQILDVLWNVHINDDNDGYSNENHLSGLTCETRAIFIDIHT